MKRASELQGEEYSYSTLSQDIEWLTDYMGIGEWTEDITGVIYRMEDGEVTEAYFTESSRPYLLAAEYFPVGYFNGDCEHPPHEDCLFCCMCNRCRENVDEDDICSECRIEE